MKKATTIEPGHPEDSPSGALSEILREGAQKLLAAALEAEVDRYLAEFADERDADGRRLVVRNGHCPEREIQTGLGGVKVRRPRVNDRRVSEDGERFQFTSKILPPYLRRTKAVEELIPWLYLKGVSTGDFSEALSALLGEGAPGLSASTVVRLKRVWESDFKDWNSVSVRWRWVTAGSRRGTECRFSVYGTRSPNRITSGGTRGGGSLVRPAA